MFCNEKKRITYNERIYERRWKKSNLKSGFVSQKIETLYTAHSTGAFTLYQNI